MINNEYEEKGNWLQYQITKLTYFSFFKEAYIF